LPVLRAHRDRLEILDRLDRRERRVQPALKEYKDRLAQPGRKVQLELIQPSQDRQDRLAQLVLRERLVQPAPQLR
jgi:hypothetical protein